ncbi:MULTISPECIES: Hvo_1808 family surface protein [Halorussus]|uniref:Hvo_1808 family surface protein n=1 Tax=Halorussus TaxID=1070314 RepID=UPI001878F043|nr:MULTISPECIES: Hvo_1808 family surface protein [Halorussus]
MRTELTFAFLVLLSGVTTFAAVPAADAVPRTDAPRTQDGAPPDPESDVLGWENGYWYNESLSVDASDGLNDSELEKVVARSMARVERIRRLEFDSRVPVRVVPRDAFSRQRGRSPPSALRAFENAKYEALFMVNESTDSLAVQRRNSGAAVGGFYSPTDDRIVVVSENVTTPRLDELTLGHELVHALQDQQFDLGRFERPTREQHNAVDGLVEGDANYVQHIYERRCNDEWAGTCLGITERPQDSAGSLANIGPYLIKFQPYSDGPAFLRSVRDEGGWERVNGLYEDPPASTEQVIHPELYGEDQPRPVRVPDRSDESWERLDVPNRVDYGEFGEAGLFSMLVYPGIAEGGNRTVIPPRSFLTPEAGAGGPDFDPYNYSDPATAGWDGDRLVVYTNDEAPANETGYVWKTVWDSRRDARQFAEAYRQLLRIHDANAVEDRESTWVIPEDREFADAFRVERRGDAVTIVNAPTVDQLSGVDSPPEAAANATVSS